MARNVGEIDRAVRIVAGLALLALTFVGPATPWGWLGLIPLVTGLAGYCPLYAKLGICTRLKKGRPASLDPRKAGS